MWLIVQYKPATLFSLKDSNATSKGAKSLIIPSQYAIKMTIVNSFIQKYSIQKLQENFKWIKDLEIEVKSSRDIVVNNCFLRVLQIKRKDSQEKAKRNPLNEFQSSVSFKEYLYMNTPITIAIKINNMKQIEIDLLKKVLLHINYFGKRGCFFQIITHNNGEFFKEQNQLECGFGQKLEQTKYLTSLLFELDDFGEKVKSFENVNNYSSEKTDRKKTRYCFPYELKSSSQKFYHYQMVDED